MADSSYTAEQLAAAQAEDVEKYPARYAMGGYIYDRLVKEDMAKNAEPSASSEDFIRRRDEREKKTTLGTSKRSPGAGEVEDLEVFPSGAVRGSQEGKSRIDLLDPRFILRVGEHMAKSANDRDGALNYAKGIPSSRYMSGLMRHVFLYYAGDRTEDHPSAIAFNAQGLAMNEGTDLDDLYDWNGS